MYSIYSQIRRDWINHGRDWTRPGFRALAFYRFGVWRMRIGSRVIRAPFTILYMFLYRKARNKYGIELPYSALIGKNIVIEHQSGIIVHGNAIIGDGTILRQGVTIGNRNRDDECSAPRIGKNVNIGAGAKILGGIEIGDNVNIGANSVVIENVASNQTVVGIPAKVVKRNK